MHAAGANGSIAGKQTAKQVAPALHPLRASSSVLQSPAGAAQTSRAASKYAIIQLGGSRQLVEEGHWYTCNKQAVQKDHSGSELLFSNVIALKHQDQFMWGQPYLRNAVVEAKLVDEFTAPLAFSLSRGAAPSQGTTAIKFFVTKISTRQDAAAADMQHASV